MAVRSSIFFLGKFILFGMLLGSTVFAQWTFSDQYLKYTAHYDRPLPGVARNNQPDTLQVSSVNPFFDDFSRQDQALDTLKWYTPEFFFDVPQKVYGLAVSPPSLGTLLFDGVSRTGEPYSTGSLATGIGDRLFSQCIDLSGYEVSDNLVLTFALQPQGRGDAPESRDFFEVLFKTEAAPPNDFVSALRVNGTSLKDFEFYAIPLNDPAYFHSCFQIAFQSSGSLSVPADYWLLDYVHLAPNRIPADTSYDDVSPVYINKSPLERYSAIPLQHFNNGSNQQAFEVELSNNSAQSRNIPFSINANDPRGFNVWSGSQSESGSQNLAPYANRSLSLNAFDNQAFNQTGSVKLELISTLTDDVNRKNDTLRAEFPVDSLWAYDDGEADGVFGLNRPLGYGIRLDLGIEDSISAVWIHFEPLVHQNPIFGTITYMNDETFRIVIWNDADPDSILVSKIHRVAYTDGKRGFVRYNFNKPVPVSGTVYVGVQQMSDLPLGVGIDRNFQNDAFMYYDSLGTWTNIKLGGSLMIRPESFHGGRFTSDVEERKQVLPARVFPNPSYQERVNFNLPVGSPLKRVVLRNMLGQSVFEQEGISINTVDLPGNLQNGFYIWELYLENGLSERLKWEYRAN
ncbi:MAG: T9SS type A sorting domain-containing protein [Bacteroidia bacterium]|nr:T9SS type A sorting domain-containing protein [Bacteroidia bacterium]